MYTITVVCQHKADLELRLGRDFSLLRKQIRGSRADAMSLCVLTDDSLTEMMGTYLPQRSKWRSITSP